MTSYSNNDETICKQVYAELVKSDYRAGSDYDQIRENIMDAMTQALNKCKQRLFV